MTEAEQMAEKEPTFFTETLVQINAAFLCF